jgi:hypothetical protein
MWERIRWLTLPSPRSGDLRRISAAFPPPGPPLRTKVAMETFTELLIIKPP